MISNYCDDGCNVNHAEKIELSDISFCGSVTNKVILLKKTCLGILIHF